METKEQNQVVENTDISPLAKDKTYGEKKYEFYFNRVLNFWTNLFGSAAFSLWAAHSTGNVPFMKEGVTPRQVQQNLAQWIEKTPVITMMKQGADVQKRRAFSMAETFTLLTPGHFIMIPSVWLGAKLKPFLVRRWDKQHYGPGSENDPTLAYRHRLIDAEAKPTFLGAVVGRFGTVLATQATARLIGSDENFVNTLGKKTGARWAEKFPGMNPLAEIAGDKIGDGLAGVAPGPVGWMNNRASNLKLDWSEAQKAAGRSGTYNRMTQNYIKYTAMDTLYTLVTASTIHPIMRIVQRIPSMTYTTQAPVDTKIIHNDGDVTQVRAPRNPLVDSVNDNIPVANDTAPLPGNIASHVQLDSRVKSHPPSAQVGA